MEKRHLPEDFRDFIKFLNSNDVEYLLIGMIVQQAQHHIDRPDI